jgi:hypothetical protein
MKIRLAAWCEMAVSLELVSCKGAAIQRGLDHGSKGIAIVGAITRQQLVKTQLTENT